VKSADQSFRFLVIKKPQGWGVALDACRICGAEGYRQDGQNVVCRHCGSAIYVPTIGEAGGCNPLAFHFAWTAPISSSTSAQLQILDRSAQMSLALRRFLQVFPVFL